MARIPAMARAFAGGEDTREGQDMESLWMVVALGAGVAGFVQGLSGFAFGMVAMIAMAPLITIQLLGLALARTSKKQPKTEAAQ